MKSRNDNGLRRSVITPLFPAFGLAPEGLNGLNPKSKVSEGNAAPHEISRRLRHQP